MHHILTGLLLGAAALCASAGHAAPIVFEGGGIVARASGSLTQTGSAGVGAPARFGFTFDPDAATPIAGGSASAVWRLPVSDVAVTIGGYRFQPATDSATLSVATGFAFFGGASSEPSRLFSFLFRGTPGVDAPFDLGAGAGGDSFSITAIYRDSDPSRPPTLADVIDPAGTPLNSFSYSAFTDSVPRRSGVLAGLFAGRFFTSPAGVPEPAGWAMMIGGFGMAGTMLRRRAGRRCAVA